MAKNNKSTATNRKKRSVGRTIWRVVWITPLALFALSILLVFLYKFVNPPLTPLMVQRFNQQLFEKGRKVHFERDYVDIDDISPHLVNAVVASEDGNFMRHHGFEVRQLKQSYRENKQGRRIRGGSTISMQTAKNAFLPHRRSMVRKAFEAYFTQLIEWTWGKKRIMECYLNIIEFGDGIYGCEAASQHYFGHSAKMLTRNEAAQLAVTLPSPLKRNPGNKTPYFRRQTNVVQARAARYGRVNLDRKPDKNGKKNDEETIFDFVKWYWEQEHKK
ncbi:MAG: monofunctional biosynthetic peptidoglycan transglycosylase [Bacteroidales bacterium]|nr:monofunctional biosynthetic peptidoglycan transglycosylase [Bacteroidales bacterium]